MVLRRIFFTSFDDQAAASSAGIFILVLIVLVLISFLCVSIGVFLGTVVYFYYGTGFGEIEAVG